VQAVLAMRASYPSLWILIPALGSGGGIAAVLAVRQIWAQEILFHARHGALLGLCAGSVVGLLLRGSVNDKNVGYALAVTGALVASFIFTAAVVMVLQYCAEA
jgi:hypothetical protein